MTARRLAPADRRKLVAKVYDAVEAYIRGGGGDGKLHEIATIEMVPRKALQFDLVVHCIGKKPQWNDPPLA